MNNVAGDYTMVVSAKTLRRDPTAVKNEIEQKLVKMKASFHIVVAKESDDVAFSEAEIKEYGIERIENVPLGRRNLTYLTSSEETLFKNPIIVLAEEGGLYITDGLKDDGKPVLTAQVRGQEGLMGAPTAAMALVLSHGKAILPRVTERNGVFIIEPLSAVLNYFLRLIETQQQSVGSSA